MEHDDIETLDPLELEEELARGGVLLVDVREPAEFAQERIPGALLYPLSTFDASRLPSDEPHRVIFYCQSGRRSLNAAAARRAAGARQAAHLGGGIVAWKRAGLPVISSTSTAAGAPQAR